VLRRLPLVVVLCMVCTIRVPAAQEPARFEADVKAAFLYQFSRYVDWPAAVFSVSRTTPFRVCVLAEEPFGRIVDKILEGETAAGRAMVRVSPDSTAIVRTCQILYIERDEITRGQALFAAVRNLPVLTVSDAADFLERGGHIALFREDNRIRFDVNLIAARQSGITLRSQLLRIARNVIREGGKTR